MKNKKGFTLVEMLAVIVILAILSLVALPAFSIFQNQTDEAYYASLERTVLFAGRNYYNDRMSLLPREVGDQNRVSLDELVRLDYLEQPVSTSNKACIGNVDVRKTERGTYEYSVCLKCDQYVNNDTCNFNETVTDGGTDSDYLTLDQTYYEVPRGEPFVAGYAKYYHNGELVKSDIAASPSWIDTSVLNTYTLTYTYKNLSVTATVKVIDVTPPGATTVEMRTGSLTGAIYTSGWTNRDVYQIFSSQDDNGGSGMKGYAISLVNRPSDSSTWTLIKHNSITQKDLVILQGKSGSDFNGTVYVWAVDNYDNFGPVTSYKLSVDQTAPAVPSITNPTNGNWTNQDIYLTLKSSDAMSGISYYQYSYDNNTWNTYADSAKETYITTPYSVECNQAAYLRVCDYAGNCSNSASTMIRIDKTVPTISYNLAGGTYNSTKSVTVTGSDSNFSYMNVHVYKNGVYDGSRSVNNKTTNTHTVSLDSDGTWTVYTQVYDQAGNKHTMGPDNGYGWYYQTYTIQSRIYCDGWYVNEDYLRPVDYGQPCTQIDYSQSTTVTVYQYRYFHRGPDGACEYINNVLHCYCACGNDCIMDGTTANNGIRSCSKPWGYTHWTLNDDCYASGAQGFWNACSSGNNERRTTTKTAYRWYR